jgi:ferredoxin
MPKLTIDNLPVEVPPGATVLDAARKLGLDIPTLCHHHSCTPQTSCLSCMVRINGGQRLLPSCAMPATDGMKVESETPEIHQARRTALELLLSDHAGDCRAPCQNVCPAHMDIPTMIRQINSGQYRDAIVTVKEHIALPAVLGRICPELCEAGCRRKNLDDSVSICRLKRFVADTDLASPEPYLPPCKPATGKKVAIIGTGPTGLAAAYYLQQFGHACTLFDDHPLPGGNLRYAVPLEKLPRQVIDQEVAIIQKLGAQFRLNTALGADITLDQLQQDFDAILLAIGEVTPEKAAKLALPLQGKGLKIDKQTLQAPFPKVFAAGACLGPFKHAVRGVAEGRNAAFTLDLFLHGLQPTVEGPAFTVRLGVLTESEQTSFHQDANPTPRAPGEPWSDPFAPPVAHDESDRCLKCDCAKLHDCSLRKYSIAYHAQPTKYKVDRREYDKLLTHPSIIHEPGKCIACGLCVQIATRAAEPLGLTYIGRGFKVKIAAPFTANLSDALQKVGQECANACPTGALTIRNLRWGRVTSPPPSA